MPPAFWGRLASKYGTKFYWQAAGEDAAVEATVNAIDTCLREPISRGQCSTVQE